MSGEMRLYGFESDERLDDDIDLTVDRWADNNGPDEYGHVDPNAPTEILEWSVTSVLKFLPSTEAIIEFMDEQACENGAGYDDCPFGDARTDRIVVGLAESLREAMAKTCTWHWADEIVKRHPIVVVDGEIHVDGEQFYKPKESS